MTDHNTNPQPGDEQAGGDHPTVPISGGGLQPTQQEPTSDLPYEQSPPYEQSLPYEQGQQYQPYQQSLPYGQGQWYGQSQGYGPAQWYGQGQPTGGSQEPVRPSRAGKIIAVVAAVLVLSACSAIAGGVVGGWTNQQFQSSPGPSETRVIDGPQLDRSSLASIASQVQPRVVSIEVGAGQGSGVVLDNAGHILTNAHVVGGAQDVVVRFSTGDRVPATVAGTDARTDIAVVQVQGGPPVDPAEFGDSAEVLVGDTVLAIGSPLGFEGSVTQGIVSAMDRTLPSPEGGPTLSGLLQTDAAINRGNSGGPLVNLSGEVVGINTAIAIAGPDSGFLGVGFAVPSNRALDVAEQLIAGDEPSHAYMGVFVDTHPQGGALLVQVEEGSPAAEAGLQEADVVVRMGERSVSDSNDLVAAVQSLEPGDSVEVVFERDGTADMTTVTLGEHDN